MLQKPNISDSLGLIKVSSEVKYDDISSLLLHPTPSFFLGLVPLSSSSRVEPFEISGFAHLGAEIAGAGQCHKVGVCMVEHD